MDKITQYLSENKGAATVMAARALGVSEKEVMDRLPEEAFPLPSGSFDKVMEELVTWGEMTMIVTNASVIFEVKASVPKGKYGHGFYNLHEKGNPVGGHLMAERFASIYMVSRPFMGKESHSVQIFDADGNAAIKFYLGRDEKGELIAEQKEKFISLKKRLVQ